VNIVKTRLQIKLDLRRNKMGNPERKKMECGLCKESNFTKYNCNRCRKEFCCHEKCLNLRPVDVRMITAF
jgi:hypothetical protein